MFRTCNYIVKLRAGVSLEAVSLFLRGRGKTVYILSSSDPTLVVLLVRFTEYDDDELYCQTYTLLHEVMSFTKT
ncbi:hypothetical protein Hanom_Chr04g00280601 [Helianthus anomalus]